MNEYPFTFDEFGKLSLNEKILKGFLFNWTNETRVFTIEENKILSIYIIKSYMSKGHLNDN
jgi:hypothetical protein